MERSDSYSNICYKLLIKILQFPRLVPNDPVSRGRLSKADISNNG